MIRDAAFWKEAVNPRITHDRMLRSLPQVLPQNLSEAPCQATHGPELLAANTDRSFCVKDAADLRLNPVIRLQL